MRVQVNLSDDMVQKVDSYAKEMGVSRSALCSMLIGQNIMSMEKSFAMMRNGIENIISSEIEDIEKICEETE